VVEFNIEQCTFSEFADLEFGKNGFSKSGGHSHDIIGLTWSGALDPCDE